MVSRTVAEVEEASAEVNSLGRERLALAAGLDNAEAAARVAGVAIRELGKIDILVNNVGGCRLNTSNHIHHISLVDTAHYKWHRVLDSNLTTAFRPCKAVLPHMIERRTGVIIALASRNVGLVVRPVVLSSRCGWGLCDPWYRDPQGEFDPALGGPGTAPLLGRPVGLSCPR